MLFPRTLLCTDRTIVFNIPMAAHHTQIQQGECEAVHRILPNFYNEASPFFIMQFCFMSKKEAHEYCYAE